MLPGSQLTFGTPGLVVRAVEVGAPKEEGPRHLTPSCLALGSLTCQQTAHLLLHPGHLSARAKAGLGMPVPLAASEDPGRGGVSVSQTVLEADSTARCGQVWTAVDSCGQVWTISRGPACPRLPSSTCYSPDSAQGWPRLSRQWACSLLSRLTGTPGGLGPLAPSC